MSKSEEPVSRCGACGQEDDHPKHQIAVGFNNPETGGAMFHEHDFNRDGQIFYHFDCPSPWHDLHAKFGVHENPDAHAELTAVADHHAAIVAACRGGLKGAKLRAAIVNGEI